MPIASYKRNLIDRTTENYLNRLEPKRILILAINNASFNDNAIKYLRRRFNHWECGLLEGKYLPVRCDVERRLERRLERCWKSIF